MPHHEQHRDGTRWDGHRSGPRTVEDIERDRHATVRNGSDASRATHESSSRWCTARGRARRSGSSRSRDSVNRLRRRRSWRRRSWSHFAGRDGTASGRGREAVQELRAHISKIREEDYPNARHAIVAHSHGGNVVLAALADETLAKADARRRNARDAIPSAALTRERIAVRSDGRLRGRDVRGHCGLCRGSGARARPDVVAPGPADVRGVALVLLTASYAASLMQAHAETRARSHAADEAEAVSAGNRSDLRGRSGGRALRGASGWRLRRDLLGMVTGPIVSRRSGSSWRRWTISASARFRRA